MQVHIFDVEHGFCAAVVTPSGELLLIDCGHNGSSGWRPSTWLVQNGHTTVTNLTVTNFDEDHVSDLPNVFGSCHVRSLSTNWNVSADWVRRDKALQGMGAGVRQAVSMKETYTGPALQTQWGGCRIERFCLSPSQFSDVNSLSLVTFVHFGGVRIVFPGDLTRPAWRVLLSNQEFRTLLDATNIFVASHHGREDGYCADVFELCRPAIVVVSDKSIMHATQEVDYGPHAYGVRWDTGEVRRVLTTRNDGKITVVENGGGFTITTGSNPTLPLDPPRSAGLAAALLAAARPADSASAERAANLRAWAARRAQEDEEKKRRLYSALASALARGR